MTQLIHVKEIQEALGDLGLSVEQAIELYGAPEGDVQVISEAESSLYEFSSELADNGISVYTGSIIEWPNEDEDVPEAIAPYVEPFSNVPEAVGADEYTDVPMSADINMIELPTIQYEEYIDVPMF